ncbi:acyl-CoA dehydrogenase family protein [Maritimibacter sp. DP1N21-5]|uniref:acyl-CoA dehydrogenase family protein n=1 Tax=Maritimibacter sp. DP1N21-5 TaxID=2836867 RepID=UPI001C478DD0|nr:acyl-CoA dehydrogenase family protein [Maritimibacter sp. DP1N21-5]MBV7407648.1 acyl-CoA dehydrogenase family protein [Maritimibacter sp. DP1N21-5]
MTTLTPTEDEVMLRDAARGFCNAAGVANLRACRDAGKPYDNALWAEMVAMGWAGVLVSEDEGGSDMGFAAANVLAEEMGRSLIASPFLSTAVIAATALRRAGRSTAAIADGTATYALALDETRKFAPEATAMEARASGNGFVVTGSKTFVADGTSASRVLVLARAEAGLTLFDVDAERAGLSRDRLGLVDSRDHATLRFHGVDATGDDVVGEVGGGLAALAPALRAGQAALSAELLGLSAGAFAMTTAYLKARKQFGRLIGSFQALQHRAAHLFCEIEVTASAIANAGRMLDHDPENADLAVSLAKARASETAGLAVREGVQMHGGIGMTDEYDMGFYMKRARVGAEWLGDYGYHAARVADLRGKTAA